MTRKLKYCNSSSVDKISPPKSVNMKQSDTFVDLNTPERGELQSETQLLHQLLKCSHFIEREMNAILSKFNLKQQQFTVLNEIIEYGPVSQKELVDRLLYGKSNISRIIKMLADKNLIQVTSAPVDKRLTLLIETTEGELLWKNCLKELNHACVEFVSQLSEKNVRVSFNLLRKLEKSLYVVQRNSKKV